MGGWLWNELVGWWWVGGLKMRKTGSQWIWWDVGGGQERDKVIGGLWWKKMDVGLVRFLAFVDGCEDG